MYNTSEWVIVYFCCISTLMYFKICHEAVSGKPQWLESKRYTSTFFYADVNILGRIVHTIKENTETLVVARNYIGLEVNADKTKYIIMSRDQNAGRSQNIKIDNSSFERVEDF